MFQRVYANDRQMSTEIVRLTPLLYYLPTRSACCRIAVIHTKREFHKSSGRVISGPLLFNRLLINSIEIGICETAENLLTRENAQQKASKLMIPNSLE